jgi:hypothetical protein
LLLLLLLDVFYVRSLQAKCTHPDSFIVEHGASMYRSVRLLNPLACRGNPGYKDNCCSRSACWSHRSEEHVCGNERFWLNCLSHFIWKCKLLSALLLCLHINTHVQHTDTSFYLHLHLHVTLSFHLSVGRI